MVPANVAPLTHTKTEKAPPSRRRKIPEELRGTNAKIPRFPFVILTGAKSIAEPSDHVELRPVVTDAELEVDWTKLGREPRPLMPWARLLLFLRKAIGEARVSGEIDVPAVVQTLSRGEALNQIPRMTRSVWANSVVVIVDCGSETWPFRGDIFHALEYAHSHAWKRSDICHRIPWNSSPISRSPIAPERASSGNLCNGAA